MKLHGHGQLNHHFYGDYSAGIGIAFDCAEDCALALPRLQVEGLGAEWKQGKTASHVAVICVTSPQLEKLKTHLGTLGADVDKIDSVDHSIDYGDPFEVCVEVDDPRQLYLAACDEIGQSYEGYSDAQYHRLRA